MQVMYLSPSHWSGQGAHSSQLANLKQNVTGRRGREEGSQEGVPAETRAKWSNQDFLRKDTTLLSTEVKEPLEDNV